MSTDFYLGLMAGIGWGGLAMLGLVAIVAIKYGNRR